MNELAGKAAFVTGAASGIGKAVAIGFAAAAAGVAVCDIDAPGAAGTVEEIEAAGGRACAVCGDVASPNDVERMVAEAAETLGPIDILVNCAGLSAIRPFLETSEAQWDRTICVNLKSVFLTCQAVLPGMRQRKSGRIINLSSQSGKRGAAWYADYCASKFAIIGLTQSLAQEFAQDGIRINAISPGFVETEMWDEAMWAGYARKRKLQPGEVRQAVVDKIPLGRMGRPEEVAKVALFLASDDSAYMTGQSINVTGGSLMS